MDVPQQQAAVASLDTLPEAVQQLIGAALTAPQPPGVNSTAWHDPGTATLAAAACMLACKGTQAIGLEAYRQLLARFKLPDMSQPPAGLSADSSVDELQAVLEAWGAEDAPHIQATGRPVRSCRSAKLWRQLQEAVQPLCPVPESSRGPGSPLLTRAPVWEYLLLRPGQCIPVDKTCQGLLQLQRASLQRYGSVEGWRQAWLQQQRAQQQRQRQRQLQRQLEAELAEQVRKQPVRERHALYINKVSCTVQQLEQLCRELALQPFTENEVQGALDKNKTLVCRRCCGSRTFCAHGLVQHCRDVHPDAFIGIWKAS